MQQGRGPTVEGDRFGDPGGDLVRVAVQISLGPGQLAGDSDGGRRRVAAEVGRRDGNRILPDRQGNAGGGEGLPIDRCADAIDADGDRGLIEHGADNIDGFDLGRGSVLRVITGELRGNVVLACDGDALCGRLPAAAVKPLRPEDRVFPGIAARENETQRKSKKFPPEKPFSTCPPSWQ